MAVQPVQRLNGRIGIARQNQMAHDHTGQHFIPVPPVLHLAAHFQQRRAHPLHIVRRSAVSRRLSRSGVLKIRQINIYQSLQLPQGL